MKRYLLALLALLCSTITSFSQDIKYEVKGKVMDTKGELLIGVAIYIKNEPGVGTVTDVNGKFQIKNVPHNAILVFRYVGYKDNEFLVNKATENSKIILKEDTEQLDEVVVVGHGAQRKVSVVGAVTTIDPKNLISPSTSVTNMLGGRVPGIISVTRSGEPGNDFSEFWVRGISTFGAGSGALVLIDGVEGNLNDLDPSDIASFSVLKDASATAVYGVRGANGVIVVTTHQGESGKLKINLKSSLTLSQSAEMPEYLRAYDYANLANEAREVRGLSRRYTPTDLDMFKYGLDPDLYPDVDWRDVILKDYTINDQHYMNVSGGGATARYFISAGLTNKSAVFKDEDVNNYGTNVKWHKYTFRSNVNANLTKSTEISMGLDGTIVKQNAPGFGDDNQALWNAQANLTPVTVPLRYSNGLLPAYGKNGNQISPYVLLNHTGYKQNQRNTMKVNFGFTQKLDALIKGLSTNALFSFTSNGVHNVSRKKMPALYKATGRYNDGSLIIEKTVDQQNLTYDKESINDRKYYFEGRLNYNRSFGNHRVGALAHYYMEDYQTTKANDEISSIPKRYQALSGRLTYSFKDIYFLESNVGYTGSENFRSGDQFGVFPSIALGWVPTGYANVKNLLPFVSYFKIRGSYGELGNDKIGGRRFPYMTYVNFNNSGKWGPNGLTEGQIGADNLRWEIAKKYNVGIDAKFLNNKIDITVDFFKDIRDGIFQERQMMPEEVGVVNKPFTNVGKMQSSGVDGTIAYTQPLGNNRSLTLRSNFTYAKNEVVHWDQAHPKYPYQNKNGVPHNVQRGLISLGLFADSTQILSSPKQTFGEVRPGDIRYKDVNGDGRIDEDDQVPLSFSNTPQVQYGMAGELRLNKWTFSILFEGVSKVQYFLGGTGYYPFAGGEQGNVLSMVNDPSNRWTPSWYSGDTSTENPDARFPRMTYGNSANNNRNSTFWLADGRYVRLKNVDVSYRWSNKVFQRAGISAVTLQLVGNNLFTWDKVDIGDAGQASSNGAAYPLQRTYTFQLSIGF